MWSRMLIFRQHRLPVTWSVWKRNRYKKRWAINTPKKDNTILALEHFDHYYKPVFGILWPSIRVALLSPQKYSALLNNFCPEDNALELLRSLGAQDIVGSARRDLIRSREPVSESVIDLEDIRQTVEDVEQENILHGVSETQKSDDGLEVSQKQSKNWQSDNSNESNIDSSVYVLPRYEGPSDSDLYDFVPVTKVYSDQQLLEMEEYKQSVFEPRDINVMVLQDTHAGIAKNLRVLAFKAGNVRNFPSPKPSANNMLGYYLLDASSVLPVIALDPQPGDSILDLCAAPGGKSLVTLQITANVNLMCNDQSHSRLQRLKTMLSWYTPDMLDTINMKKQDGGNFTEPIYDKVLVDVPCNNDRHVLSVEENNLFQKGRMHDRMALPKLQKDLLVAGIKSCRPGGTVVYSTCTLAMPQNDGVVQAAIEDIWMNTKIEVAVQNIGWIANSFQRTFRFYKNCRYGQLVLPILSSNFGPMYFSKIKRIS